MVEKRKYKRATVKMKVIISNDTQNKKMGTVIDISKNGMFVQTEDAPEVKGALVASIDAENFGKVIWVEGHVVRRISTGIGVMFTNTDEKGLNNLLDSMSAVS